MEFTISQAQRLRNLGCTVEDDEHFETAAQRDAAFKAREKASVRQNRFLLAEMKEHGDPVMVNALARDIAAFLASRGFMEVSTPIIISAGQLENMTIGEEHPLHDQVFWLDSKSCLRPMLAPGLYSVSRQLINILGSPLRVFEIGPCFRKESQGSWHLNCFTMVNFVEWGVPEAEKHERASQLVSELMQLLELEYELVEDDSVVYGKTFDVQVNGEELASGAFGPHPLDDAWGITGTWLGVGMGLERAVCLRRGIDNIQRVSRSLVYHNGASLQFK